MTQTTPTRIWLQNTSNPNRRRFGCARGSVSVPEFIHKSIPSSLRFPGTAGITPIYTYMKLLMNHLKAMTPWEMKADHTAASHSGGWNMVGSQRGWNPLLQSAPRDLQKQRGIHGARWWHFPNCGCLTRGWNFTALSRLLLSFSFPPLLFSC